LKLLNKTNRYYFTAALIVFLVGTGVFYLMLNHIMEEEANEQLLSEKAHICSDLDKLGDVQAHFLTAGDRVEITLFPSSPAAKKEDYLRDTTLYSLESKEDLSFRKLSFMHNIKGADGITTPYLITITRPLFETDDLILTIVKSMLILLSLLLGVMFEVNRRISKKLWKPFYATLNQAENFTVAQNNLMNETKTGIQEFDDLNKVLKGMTRKISDDYRNLKDFSENASHEIQTPLAIIKAKLELLIQSDGLKEGQIKLISEAYESAGRLSKLNQALILLTRIGNNQFAETRPILLNELIQTKLTHFQELIAHQHLLVEQDLSQGPEISIHPVLADVLISNLVGNAIKHNQEGGKITVTSDSREIRFRNTGPAPLIDTNLLFERFRKGTSSSDSLGLGLAIVKQICDSAGILIRYTFEDGFHTLALNFPLASS
jgi:signal transduction histidine kinase